ncbi:MAG: teichuronic acid biosynthesis protein TuaE [Saprospiraceae bacterium]|jgi:teichuronic acid biosynthesis protein TuaE
MRKLYSVLLVLLLAAFPAGSNLFSIDLGIGSIYLFRIVLLISLFLLLARRKLIFYNSIYTKRAFYLLLIWVSYAFLSMLWAVDVKLAIVESLYLVKALLLFVVIVSLSKQSDDGLKTIHWSWILGLLITMLLAVFEIYSGQHVKGIFTEFLKNVHPLRPAFRSIISVFSGPNEYCVYLCLSVPFLLYKIPKKFILLSFLVVIFTFYVVYKNDARVAVIALIFQGIMFSVLFFKQWRKKIVEFIRRFEVKVSLVIIFASIFYFAFFLQYVKNPRTTHDDYSMIASFGNGFQSPAERFLDEDGKEIPMGSLGIRKGLIFNGVLFLKDSYFLGVGAGNYKKYIKDQKGEYNTKYASQPHAWWIEILSQYGLIIFSLYFGFVGMLFLFFLKMKKRYEIENQDCSLVIFGMVFLVTFLLVSNASSTFINNPVNWISFSILTLVADKIYLQVNSKNKDISELE